MRNIIILLGIALMLSCALNVHAEERSVDHMMKVTVGDIYALNTKLNNKTLTEAESIDLLGMLRFFDGVRWGLAMPIDRREKNGEKIIKAITDCIDERPIRVVFDNICDQYKVGNFKGSDPLFHVVEKDYVECALKALDE